MNSQFIKHLETETDGFEKHPTLFNILTSAIDSFLNESAEVFLAFKQCFAEYLFILRMDVD